MAKDKKSKKHQTPEGKAKKDSGDAPSKKTKKKEPKEAGDPVQNPYQIASLVAEGSKSQEKGKTKGKAKNQEGEKSEDIVLTVADDTPVEWLWEMEVTLEADLHPARARNPKLGVQEYLNGLLYRPLPHCGGGVLAWRAAKIAGSKGIMLTNVPYFRTSISVTLALFAPKEGLQLGMSVLEGLALLTTRLGSAHSAII